MITAADRSPMISREIKQVMLEDVSDELKNLHDRLVGTDDVPGDSSCIPRIIELHMSMALYYARRLAKEKFLDSDVAVSDFMFGMMEACLRLYTKKATVTTTISGYILSGGRSAVENGMSSTTGWKSWNYSYARKKNRKLAGVQSCSELPSEDPSERGGYFQPSYRDDAIDLRIEIEDLMANLSEIQCQMLALYAKGYDDKEVAEATGYCFSYVMRVKASIIQIMEKRVRKRD